MPDAYFAPAAVVAGILCGSAVIAASRNPTPLTWRWPVPPSLEEAMRRAGWSETPERVLVLTLVRSAVLAAIGSSSGLLFGPSAAVTLAIAGVIVGPAWLAYSLHAAITGRRARLARDLAAELEIPAIASLATIIAASREYGTSVAPGVRALATDLRQAQRRELIAHSRRALNHVLFPAAIGVLLPFLCILLFPAVTTLQANLR